MRENSPTTPSVLQPRNRSKLFFIIALVLVLVAAMLVFLLLRWQGSENYDPAKRLIKGGYIITMDEELGNFRGDVLLDGDEIVEVAPEIEAERGVEEIDARDMIVMPGYVDNHKHLWESLVRGVSANADGREHRDVVLSPLPEKLTVDDMYIGTYLGALDALANGSTTVLNWDLGSLTLEHAKAAVRALDDAGVRGLYSFSASYQTQNDPDSSPTEDEFRELAEITSRNPLLSMHMGTRNPINRDVFPRVVRDFELARELGITISLHAGLPTSQAVPGFLAENGLLGSDVIFVNGSAFTEAEMSLVKEHGAWITSVPEVEMQLGTPTPLGFMLEAGLKPTVSTDSYAQIPSDMPTQLRMLLQAARENGVQTESGMLTTADVLPYGNINAAASLGMEDEIGSLTPGKQADLILLRNTDPNLFLEEPENAAVQAHPGNIDTVIVAGRILKRDGELTGISKDRWEELRNQARQANERLLEVDNDEVGILPARENLTNPMLCCSCGQCISVTS